MDHDDCNVCGREVLDDSYLCQSCWEIENQERTDQEAATKLMRALGLPLYKSGTTLNYNEYSLRAVDLYRIFINEDKLKELIFKLKNKAFV